MHNGNKRLKNENESKPLATRIDLLDQYYVDVYSQTSDTRSSLDLERDPPSETAIEGTLVMLATLYARPIEFSGNTKTIDLLNDRTETKFYKDIPTSSSLGPNISNPEHAFFSDCYLNFLPILLPARMANSI